MEHNPEECVLLFLSRDLSGPVLLLSAGTGQKQLPPRGPQVGVLHNDGGFGLIPF